MNFNYDDRVEICREGPLAKDQGDIAQVGIIPNSRKI